MSMRDYDPWGGMLSLREAMNRLLEESYVTSGARGGVGSLQMPLDIYETREAIVVRTSMPGVRPEDIDITVTGDQLTIRGEIGEHTPGTEARYHQREHRHGSFARSITLPVEVQPDKVEATFEHGVLTLTMPKAERMRPKQIKINTRGSATSIGTPSGASAAIEGQVSDAAQATSGTSASAGGMQGGGAGTELQDAGAAGPSDESAAMPAENAETPAAPRRRSRKKSEG